MVRQAVPLLLHTGSDTSCSITYLGLLAKAPSLESSGPIASAETLYNDLTMRSTIKN